MKPLIMMTVQRQSLVHDTPGKAIIFANALEEDDNFEAPHVYFPIDLADAVLFPAGTKISITIEALEA